MVTKSEEENIMDKAVGSKIADYLIKPVNPNQVLLSIKKNVHSQQLVTEQTTADYRSEFGRISSSFADARTFADWVQIYRKAYNWEMENSPNRPIRASARFSLTRRTKRTTNLPNLSKTVIWTGSRSPTTIRR